MADLDDEDIFADLYDGDDTVDIAPQAKAPALAPVAVSQPVLAQPAVTTLPPPVQEAVANAEAPSYTGHAFATSNGVPPPNGANTDWSNQGQGQSQGQPSWEAQHQEETERPIGSKEDGKMFIGGLNWETTDQSLRDYFTQFGDVTECTVMRDSGTGRSRGFGFLTFRDPKCVNTVMVKEHQLDGKIIDPKRAIPREEQERTSKIFVGGVSQEATEHDFKTFFQQFGRVLDATLMMDKDTGRPRGFGFVTFDSEAAVDRTLAGPLEILGKMIEVKKAQPRGNMINENDGGGGRGRGRGFGGGMQFNNNNSGNGAGDMMAGGNGMGMGGGAGGMPGQAGMTPNMMAQYWARMQQYFGMMQQQMMAGGGGGGGPGGAPNPAMMQQMMMMQQMQQQQQQQGGGGNAAAAGNNMAFPQQDQQAFDRQNGGAGSPFNNSNSGGGGGGSSWEGMYDDVPAPPGQQGMMDEGNMMGRGGGRGRGGRGGFFRGGGGGGRGGGMAPANAPAAPAGAPTGPKNMVSGGGRGGYRGGGRGGHRGFHPYAR